MNTTVPFSKLGWMAVGFGSRMGGSPMVILWPNADGTITLSQRASSNQEDPHVVSNPARVATVETSLSSLTGPVTLSFSVPSSGKTTENMIYALSMRKPGSSDPSAALQEHNFKGSFQLDLTQTVADLPSPSASSSAVATGTPTASALPVPTQESNNDQSFFVPYTSYEKKFVAHGVLSALGFCFFLPIGVLQARLLRIWWPKWFKAHWIAQAGLAGPAVVLGFVLGVVGIRESGGRHFNDKHTIIGLVLLVLYALQALYGYIIHVVKSPNRKKRPVQNYGHAIVGLGLIMLAFYQVWSGFDDEWARATGRDKPMRALYTFWIVWAVLLGAVYVLGLAFLPKQYASEAAAVRNREKPNDMSGSAEEMGSFEKRDS